MGSVSASCPALPDIGDLSSLFPEHCRGSEYSIVHVYAGVTLLAFGAEKRIPELWQQIAQLYAQDEAAQATATRRLREGLVKASPLIGFPRVRLPLKQNLLVLAFSAFHSTHSDRRPSTPSQPSEPASSRPPLPASSHLYNHQLLPHVTGSLAPWPNPHNADKPCSTRRTGSTRSGCGRTWTIFLATCSVGSPCGASTASCWRRSACSARRRAPGWCLLRVWRPGRARRLRGEFFFFLPLFTSCVANVSLRVFDGENPG